MLNMKKTGLDSYMRTTKRLLGSILVDGEFIAPHDLEIAIERQKQTNDQLGDILVSMGVLDPRELKAVLSIQKDLTSLDDAVKVAAGVRLLLGELLLKAKKLTQAQIDLALQEQRRTGEKIGEVFVRLGFLMEHELNVLLAFQQHQGGQAPASEKLRLGEILVSTGQITREQLEDVLTRQKVSKKNIGQLLIDAGYMKPDELDYGLKLQQKLVTAALIAALSMANLFGAKEAYSGPGGNVSAKIGISATVLERSSMQVLNQINEFVVTNADIKRGYVELPAASRINVKTNNRAGCLLAFEVMGGTGSIFEKVFVRIGGQEVQLSSGGGWVQQPYMQGGVTQDLSYRFALSKDVQPGTYNWPIMISVLPI